MAVDNLRKNNIVKIIKYYSFTNWTEYSKLNNIDPQKIKGMNKTITNTITCGRPCVITTFIDNSGRGYEIRKTVIK